MFSFSRLGNHDVPDEKACSRSIIPKEKLCLVFDDNPYILNLFRTTIGPVPVEARYAVWISVRVRRQSTRGTGSCRPAWCS